MLPRSHDSVLLQNDLTAVVTGTPSAGLLTLLDGAATPESRSGAWTWRFLNTRSLRALTLVRLAPTVLVSAKPQAETLAALRGAGYAPAGVRADGTPAIEIPQRRRAAPPRHHADTDDMPPMPTLRDPAEVAGNLLANHLTQITERR
jgi:hypothetical protein